VLHLRNVTPSHGGSVNQFYKTHEENAKVRYSDDRKLPSDDKCVECAEFITGVRTTTSDVNDPGWQERLVNETVGQITGVVGSFLNVIQERDFVQAIQHKVIDHRMLVRATICADGKTFAEPLGDTYRRVSAFRGRRLVYYAGGEYKKFRYQ
jgi:hypothetical protein